MLSKEDQDRIRDEEEAREFRKAERRKLAGKKDGPVLKFLNKPLGIWLLPTIVVGLFTWSYTLWKDSRTSASQKAETVRRLADC
jgi:hypothetical protein